MELCGAGLFGMSGKPPGVGATPGVEVKAGFVSVVGLGFPGTGGLVAVSTTGVSVIGSGGTLQALRTMLPNKSTPKRPYKRRFILSPSKVGKSLSG